MRLISGIGARAVRPRITFVCIALAGIFASVFQIPQFGVFSLLFFLIASGVSTSLHHGKGIGFAYVTTYFIVASLIVGAFGQFIAPIPIWMISSGFYLVIGTTVMRDRNLTLKSGHSTKILVFASIGTLIFNLLIRLKTSVILTLLGLGYDNSGNLAMFRQILLERRMLIGSIDSEKFISLFGSGPQGAPTAMAYIGWIVGIDGKSVHNSLLLLFLAAILIPAAIFWISTLIIFRVVGNKKWRAVCAILIGITIFFGYSSHLWISGFLTSNFATMIIFLGVMVSLSPCTPANQVWLLCVLTIVELNVYSLFAPLIAILVFSTTKVEICAIRLELRKYLSSKSQFMLAIGISLVGGILIWLPLYGVLSRFGGSKFLVEGFFAPIPLEATMLLFGLTMVTNLSGSKPNSVHRRIAILGTWYVSIGLLALGIAWIGTYEPGQQWFVPYYPQKLLAAIVLILCVFMLVVMATLRAEILGSMFQIWCHRAMVMVVASLFIFGGINRWPFTGGYMGSTHGVIKSILTREPAVVDGKLVLDWVDQAQRVDRPVLVIISSRESELNTRWVNLLTLNWSDKTWGGRNHEAVKATDEIFVGWIDAREFIEAGDLISAQAILSNEFLLITDDSNLIQSFDRNHLPIQYCLYSIGELPVCNI
jgi:hypothetical protein